MTDTFEIKLTGNLLPGHASETTAKALAAMLKISPEQALALLAGRETVVKRNLNADGVPRYIQAIEGTGAEVRAQRSAPATPPAAPTAAGTSATLALMPMQEETAPQEDSMRCPACGTLQSKRNLCLECGTDMPRMLAAQAEALCQRGQDNDATSASSRPLANDGRSAGANPFQAPTARVDDIASSDNNSGEGRGIIPPPGVKGWSWGAFLLNWIWAVFNKTWIGLLCLLPYVGFVMSIYLGIKGRELAWQNKRWDSVEHFNQVQRRWSVWGLVLVLGAAGIGILAAIMLPAYVEYARAARGG